MQHAACNVPVEGVDGEQVDHEPRAQVAPEDGLPVFIDAPLDHEATSWTPGRPARAPSSSSWRSQGGYPLLGRLGSSPERPESSPGTELAYRPPSRVVIAVRKLQASTYTNMATCYIALYHQSMAALKAVEDAKAK